MVERIAHPGIAHPIGRQALVILAPDFLILEGIGCSKPPCQVPGQGIDFAALLDILDDDGQVSAWAEDGLHTDIDLGQTFNELLIIRDIPQVIGIIRIEHIQTFGDILLVFCVAAPWHAAYPNMAVR